MGTETPVTYEIRVEEHLSDHWSGWLNGMSLNYNNQDETILTGTLADQAALFGVLIKIRDLGLTLILVRRIETNNVNLSI